MKRYIVKLKGCKGGEIIEAKNELAAKYQYCLILNKNPRVYVSLLEAKEVRDGEWRDSESN